MTAVSANRRALTSVCRAQSTSRLVHSSSVNHATALSTAHLSGQEVQEVTLQPIFDIFDAPTRLAESSEFIRDKYKSASTRLTQTSSPTVAAFNTPQPRPLPTPLPAPIIFDGPARPKNAALAFQSRMRQAGLAPSSPARPMSSTPTSTRPFSSSEPLVQMFDGPARITRYHHQPSGENQQNSTKLIIALGIAGAVGCATLANENEKSQSR